MYVTASHRGCTHAASTTVSISMVPEVLRKAHEREKDTSPPGTTVESISVGRAYLGKTCFSSKSPEGIVSRRVSSLITLLKGA